MPNTRKEIWGFLRDAVYLIGLFVMIMTYINSGQVECGQKNVEQDKEIVVLQERYQVLETYQSEIKIALKESSERWEAIRNDIIDMKLSIKELVAKQLVYKTR